MYVVVPICSICERVRDEAGESGGGQWLPLRDYRTKYGLLPGEIWGAHTECPSCAGQYERVMAANLFKSMPSLPA
jgi:hypothetical protein